MTATACPRTNWAGNIAFAAPDFHRPASVGELRAVVARARQVRVLGTGHSFNDMADSPGAQVSLAELPPEVEVDSAASLVRVAAGLSYAAWPPGWTGRLRLRNLASLPHISVARPCATGTHGSGPANQNLSAAVAGLELVTADGDVVELRRGDDTFPGAVVHLGALGVVTRLILEVVPSFEVSQRVYEGLPLEVLDDYFAEIMASGYSVSMFTDWRAPRLTQLWIKSLPTTGPGHRGRAVVHRDARPGRAQPGARPAGRNCTAQLGVPGPWFERLPHFKPQFTPSAATSCSPSTCSPPGRRSPPCTRCSRSASASPRRCGSARSGGSPRTSCG